MVAAWFFSVVKFFVLWDHCSETYCFLWVAIWWWLWSEIVLRDHSQGFVLIRTCCMILWAVYIVLGDCTAENLFWWVVAAWHDSQSCEIVLQDHSQSHLFCTTTFMNTFIWLKDFWPQIVGSSCTELLLSLSVKLWLGDYHSRRRSLEGSIFLGAHAVCIQSSALLFFTTNDKSFEMYTSKKTLWCFFYWIAVRTKGFHLGIPRIQVYPRTLKEQNFLII